MPLMSPHPFSQLRKGSGCTAAMRHQGAQERHDCRKRLSTEAALRRNCAPSLRGSHRGTADYVALGLATSSIFQNGDADLPGGLRHLVPSPHTWEWCACVCQGARVSFTDLLPLQGSPPLGASSKFLPLPLPSPLEGEKGPQGSWTAPRPYPSTALDSAFGLWLGC